MPTGQLQLNAIGAQDKVLTQNPEVTFFKSVYRQHTNFSIESVPQIMNNSAGLGGNGNPTTTSCTVSKSGGDLVHKMYIEMDIENESASVASNWSTPTAHRIIKNVSIHIGGQLIDQHDGQWLEIWNELTLDESKKDGYKKMIGCYDDSVNSKKRIYIPLQFWFCRNPGLSIPIVSLQYPDIKITAKLNRKENVGDIEITEKTFRLWVDYIFLDKMERRKFSQSSHEYLIEQLQKNPAKLPQHKPRQPITNQVYLNHPVKFLAWVSRKTTENDFKYEPLGLTTLKLNGDTRVSERDGSYFDTVQPYQHFPNVPMKNNSESRHINVYSFALKAADHQPSGTCNMSRIDSVQLETVSNTNDECDLDIYAMNYNILRVMSGMCTLMYAN